MNFFPVDSDVPIIAEEDNELGDFLRDNFQLLKGASVCYESDNYDTGTYVVLSNVSYTDVFNAMVPRQALTLKTIVSVKFGIWINSALTTDYITFRITINGNIVITKTSPASGYVGWFYYEAELKWFFTQNISLGNSNVLFHFENGMTVNASPAILDMNTITVAVLYNGAGTINSIPMFRQSIISGNFGG